jgi:hypothetical protein
MSSEHHDEYVFVLRNTAAEKEIVVDTILWQEPPRLQVYDWDDALGTPGVTYSYAGEIERDGKRLFLYRRPGVPD